MTIKARKTILYPEKKVNDDDAKMMRKKAIPEEANTSHWLKEFFTVVRIEKKSGQENCFVEGRDRGLLRREVLKVQTWEKWIHYKILWYQKIIRLCFWLCLFFKVHKRIRIEQDFKSANSRKCCKVQFINVCFAKIPSTAKNAQKNRESFVLRIGTWERPRLPQTLHIPPS